MKKISSKIIISLMLALFLWSGVGFSLEKTWAAYDGYMNGDQEKALNEACAGQTGESWASCAKAFISLPSTNLSAERQAYISKKIDEGTARLLATQKAEEEKPGFFESIANGIMGFVTGPIGETVMMVHGIILQVIAIPLMSILLRIAAAMLDLSVNFTLSTEIFTKTSSGVVIVWTLIRDICNTTFIFILLWAAIQMVIGLAGSNTKKIIVNVVIAALLINFSLFITRILIDAGNILGVSLYNNIIATNPGKSLDSIIMGALGMSGVIGAFKSASVGGVYTVSFGIISNLQLIVLVVGFFAFLYAMLLMAIRIVVLIFLVALSPIGFMGSVIPKMEEYAKMWRETLYGQIMVAPIFLLFLYLIILISKAFTEASATISANKAVVEAAETAAAVDPSTQYTAYFKYVMVILLLIIAIKITKKMTGVVGAAVEGFAKSLAGAGIGIATGGAAFALRATLGRGANAIANSQTLKDGSVSNSFTARIASKAAMATGGFVSKKSFDVRNISAINDASKKHLGINTQDGAFGTKIGSAGKGGYAGRISEQEKAAEERAKMLSAGISASDTEIATARETRERRHQDEINERNDLNGNSNRTDEQEARLKKIQSSIKSYAAMTTDKEKNEAAEADIIQKKKEARLEKAAKLEEGLDFKKKSIFQNPGKYVNSILGGSKEKAKKIRASLKKKDAKTQVAEAVQKLSEEAAPATPPAATPAPTATPSTSNPQP